MKTPAYIDRLSNAQRLRLFFEIATAGTKVGNAHIPDPACKKNIKKAKKWFNMVLGFLTHQDRFDLILSWNRAIEDGRDVGWFYKNIKILCEKYDEQARSADIRSY